MADETHDRDAWEQRWAQALREHGDEVAARPPNSHLLADVGDLGIGAPPHREYDLVSCLYVHVAGSVAEMVTRLGDGVAPGGTLFLVGHLPVDPATGEPTPAVGQVQVTVDDAVDGLHPAEWQVVTAEQRTREVAGSGADAVIRAVRRS